MIKKYLFVFVIGLTLGCANRLPVGTSPEGVTAVKATQVIAALRASLPVLKAATCQPGVIPPCLAPADTDRVVTHIQTASTYAQELAVVLKAVDEAQTAALQTEGMTKARALLVSIQNSLTQAAVSPGAEDSRQKVVSILGAVMNLLLTAADF